MAKKIFFFCFLCISQIQISFSQGYAGRDFYYTSLDYFYSCYDTTNLTQGIYVISPYAAKVQFANPTSLGSAPSTINLTPNKAEYIRILNRYQYPLSYFDSDVKSKFVAHLISDSDVMVTFATQTDSFRKYRSKGAAAVLPTSSIPYGPEYIVTTNLDSRIFRCVGGLFESRSPQFMVVGIAPLSRLEIITTAQSTVRTEKPGKPFYIELKQGETFYYTVRKGDPTGTIIRSKDSLSKFAVFAGDRLSGSSMVDSTNTLCSSGDDFGVEQMIPTASWGKSYTAMPFKEMYGGYYLKIVASQNNTRVYINGTYNRTLNEGQYFTYNVTTRKITTVKGDKPIFVTQFIKGASCSMHPVPKFKLGDHEQLNLTADTFNTTFGWISTVSKFELWFNDSLVLPENYINIICQTTDTASIILDGQKINQIEWKQDALISGKSYAQVSIDSGSHILNSINPFNYYVYGYAEHVGYAYQGNSNTKPFQNNFVYDIGCLWDTLKFHALNTTDFYNFSWNFGDGSATVFGSSVKHQYKDTGWHNTALYFRHKLNNSFDSITKRVYVAQAGPSDILIDNNNVFIKDTMVCGKLDINVYAIDFNYDNDYLWEDGGKVSYKNFDLPGEHSIILKSRNTCVAYDTIRITNNPLPTAVFTSTDTGFCENMNREVTYFNKSYAPDSIVKNVWDFGILDFENNDSVVKNKFPRPGQYLVKLRVYSVTGCWHDTFQQFTMLPAPHPKFDLVNVDSCLNTNHVSFINQTVVDTTLFKWYKWYFSEGYVISRSNPSGPRKYDSAGLFTANLIYEYNNSCFDTFKRKITIYENPDADFKTANALACFGDSLHFVNTSKSAYTPLSSNWDFGDAQTSTLSDPAHLYTNKQTYSVKLKVRSPLGCTDSVIKPVYISGNTKANFSINDSVQCFDQHLFKFKNTSVSDTGNIKSVVWKFGDASTSTLKDSVSKTYLQSGKYTVSLNVENDFGCRDSIIKQVKVIANPKGQITVNNSSQCEDKQDFDFTFVPLSINDSIQSYKWLYVNDSVLGGKTLYNIQFPTLGSFVVRIKTTTAEGCLATQSKTVFVNPKPKALFSVLNKQQCFSGHQFTFTNQSTLSQGSIKTNKWEFGDNSTSFLENPPNKKYASAGKYTVKLSVESDSGCIATAEDSLELFPKANVQIAIIPSVCLNDSSVFSATVSGATVLNYKWDFGDQSSSSLLKTKHQYATAGAYKVQFTTLSDKGCADTFSAQNNAIVMRLPVVDFKKLFISGDDKNTLAKFTNTSPISKTVLWDFGTYGKSILNDTQLNIKDSVTLKVTLKVSDQNGCYNSKTEYVFISGPLELFFPNVFSPNGDGHNDGFGPVGIDFAYDYKFTIYNRWGEIMYQSSKPGEIWDGTYKNETCPLGVYIFTLELRDFFGRYQNYEGSFLLKR